VIDDMSKPPPSRSRSPSKNRLTPPRRSYK
jgi:hypothetical protein